MQRKRIDIDQYFMTVAYAIAQRSTCHDKQVGCILVDANKHIVATGYNGPISGVDHCESCDKDVTGYCPAVHAEQNAVAQCTSHPRTCYCTLTPCNTCLKLLAAAGVDTVYIPELAVVKGDTIAPRWLKLVRVAVPIATATPQTGTRRTLQAMGDLIYKYHRKLNYPVLKNCSSITQEAQNREIMLAINQEVAELTDSMAWKPWRASGSTNYDNLLEEAVDIMFFLGALLENNGLTWAAFEERFERKLKENYNRIEEGYHK